MISCPPSSDGYLDSNVFRAYGLGKAPVPHNQHRDIRIEDTIISTTSHGPRISNVDPVLPARGDSPPATRFLEYMSDFLWIVNHLDRRAARSPIQRRAQPCYTTAVVLLHQPHGIAVEPEQLLRCSRTTDVLRVAIANHQCISRLYVRSTHAVRSNVLAGSGRRGVPPAVTRL